MRRLAGLLLTLAALGVTLWALRRPHPPRELDFRPLSFADLGGYPYEPRRTALPERVKRLQGQQVRLEGFMLPVDFSGRRVRTFILAKDQNACCFGIMPAFNEWVMVRVEPDRQAEVMMDHPVRVYGRLEVGEEPSAGPVTSLYRLQAVFVGKRQP